MQERMIRLFVSSTFRDFEEERNRLAAEVYPELEALCRKRGFSFHVIDLRWGVSREDAAENQSARICFDELRRCQEMSPQLNFLIMAGDRYGWRPLPAEICAEEWERLTDGLDCDDPFRRKMEACYMLDQNSLEKTHILRADGGLRGEADRRKFHRLLERQARERLPEEEAVSNTGEVQEPVWTDVGDSIGSGSSVGSTDTVETEAQTIAGSLMEDGMEYTDAERPDSRTGILGNLSPLLLIGLLGISGCAGSLFYVWRQNRRGR